MANQKIGPLDWNSSTEPVMFAYHLVNVCTTLSLNYSPFRVKLNRYATIYLCFRYELNLGTLLFAMFVQSSHICSRY